MKTFVLFALTLCVAQCEMSRKLFTGQRSKSKLDQGSHHRPGGVAGTGRAIRQFFRRKFGYHRAFPESRSSSRIARSAVLEEGSGRYIEFVAGSIPETDNTVGSGSSSGSSSGFGSGFGSGSSLTMPLTLTDQVKPEGSKTVEIIGSMHKSSNNNYQKPESNNSNGGIMTVLKSATRKVKRSVDGFPGGSGDTGSGVSSEDVLNIPVVLESSGTELVEEVVVKTDVMHIQYAQGESVAATSVGSGSVTCKGEGCEQGSGNIEIHDTQIQRVNSDVQQNIGPGEDFQGSGMSPVSHKP